MLRCLRPDSKGSRADRRTLDSPDMLSNPRLGLKAHALFSQDGSIYGWDRDLLSGRGVNMRTGASGCGLVGRAVSPLSQEVRGEGGSLRD